MNFECISSVFFNVQKSTLNAICGVPEHLAILLFAFDAWFWRYMWCSRALGHFIVCLRCLILTLFVVAGSTFASHCLSSMLNFVGICGVPEHLVILLLSFDAWLWRYMWCSNALGHFIVCLRCLILTLFVVAGRTSGGHCLSSMLDFDAICRVWAHLALIELPSEVDFERYLWCSRAPEHFIVCLRCLILTLFVVFERTWLS